MNKETLKALKGSIRKWEAISKGEGLDNGVDNCPLCLRFWNRRSLEMDHCTGCPVSEKTGLWGCVDTPYSEWLAEQPQDYDGSILLPAVANTKIREKIARAELKFLRSLLP